MPSCATRLSETLLQEELALPVELCLPKSLRSRARCALTLIRGSAGILARRASTKHPSALGVRGRLRLLPLVEPQTDLCDEIGHRN